MSFNVDFEILKFFDFCGIWIQSSFDLDSIESALSFKAECVARSEESQKSIK